MTPKQILMAACRILRSHPALMDEPAWRETLVADLVQLARLLK